MFKKIRLRKTIFFSIIFFIVLNTFLLSQEKKFNLTIKDNPTDWEEYWWLKNNSYGIPNLQSQLKWKFDQNNTHYQLSIAADENGKIYIGDSFIKHNFSDKTFLRMGRYYRDFSTYLNDNLSSGHMLISHNARPMPKIGIVTSKSIKKFEKLTFEGGIAHGIFEKENFYTKAPLLHEKFIYMHIKNNDYRISWGLVHEAMWGGGYPERNFSHSFKDFLKIFTAEDGFDEQVVGSHQNALGNHVAIWDFIFEKTNNDKLAKLYYQHIFEETSGLRFKNGSDGLWGLELTNYIPKTNLLIEYLVTSNQFRNPNHFEKLYYYHYHYRLGWSYNNYILGNPNINLPVPEDYPNWPLEKVDVIHLGMNGKFLSSNYQVKISRRINTHDDIQSIVNFDKNINTNLTIGLFLAYNNENNALGFLLSKNF
jgi:hypothetical protein